MNYFSRVGIDFPTVGLKKETTGEVTEQDIVNFIFEAITETFGVSKEHVQSKSRIQTVRQARQFTHYFLKEWTKMSLRVIGAQTFNDHSSALHSIKTVKQDIQYDARLKEAARRIKRLIEIKIYNHKNEK